ncbi:DUF1385 domain-containing protein [Petroclostridium sp. X23]|uniref:DUF1385 domain-containing protein n=1 Tax=Petroclostridium sp. X23 TaxID=3045146 RepID=UPI0024AD2057|nr:DUF1385 domain-containing protein [Petroclostridium sp. X23]WHH61684.1 DUF1385 domain-containing protein [Petroclostridium sp. X23]
MMRGPKDIAIAVRTPDGTITVDKKPVQSVTMKYKFLKLPILRGVIAFFESMIIGVKSLMFSAEFFDLEEEEQPSKVDKFLEKVFGDKLQEALIYFSVAFALLFGVGLFMLLPTVIVGFVKQLVQNHIVANIAEGTIRILLFLAYILLISKMQDIQKVFQYHGAEHKTIHCYEHNEELTVDNVKKYTTLHPRCGTSFLLIVMVVSIIVFSFISWQNIVIRLVSRLLLLPLVAGVSYEIIKYAGKYQNPFTCVISKPGILLQKLTTREPDGSQIEVAIEALKNVLTQNREDDKW